MAIYSLGVITTNVTIANANWEIRTASTDRSRVIELGFFLNAATASTVGFGRPGAIGVTPTSPVTFLAEDPGDPAATVTSALAWGTGPTVPTAFLRRVNLPATIGTGVVWNFPRGVVIAISSSLVLWNITATSALNAYAVEDE
jgi:hypothetical protein